MAYRLRAAFFPGPYLQGPGALEQLGQWAQELGGKALVIAGQKALEQGGDRLRAGLGAVEHTVLEHGGECTDEEAERLRQQGEQAACQFVVGFGGGKALDISKAVGSLLDLPVLAVPATAATPAACTGLAAFYTGWGSFSEYRFYPRTPARVIVDTDLIVRAPARYLAAGMGHAVAARFQAEANVAGRRPAFSGGVAPTLIRDAADSAYNTLLEFGWTALRAVEVNTGSPAVERVIEANLLLTGLVLENAGMAAAHAICNGLSVLPQASNSLSGEKAAFGAMAQLLLEGRPQAQVEEMLDFYRRVRLPTCLAALGVEDAGEEEIMQMAHMATAEGETMSNQPFPVTTRMVYEAIAGADAWGRAYASRSLSWL